MNGHSSPMRINALTGLRFFAATGVYISHISAPDFAPGTLKTMMAAGYNGVTLFFVLSGFVLAWNYTDRLTSPSLSSLWSFAVARFARIYPLYLFALVWAAAPSLISHTLPAESWMHILAIQTWSPNLGVAYALNGPGWSIGVELFLYACFPLLILPLARIKRSTTGLIVIGAMAMVSMVALAWWFTQTGRADLPWSDPASDHRWLYRTPVARLGDFVVGIVAALLVQRKHVHPHIGHVAQAVGIAAILMLMGSSSMLYSAWSWDSAYLLPVFLLLWGLAAAPQTPIARLLSTRPLILLGEASFAFYLLHQPLIKRLSIGTAETWHGWALITALEFTMILLIAIGAHIAIERPAQSRIRRALDRRGRRRDNPEKSRLTTGPAATALLSASPLAPGAHPAHALDEPRFALSDTADQEVPRAT